MFFQLVAVVVRQIPEHHNLLHVTSYDEKLACTWSHWMFYAPTRSSVDSESAP